MADNLTTFMYRLSRNPGDPRACPSLTSDSFTILNLDTRWMSVVARRGNNLLLPESVGLEQRVISGTCRESNHDSSVVQAIAESLYRLKYTVSKGHYCCY